jgi:hypothetical protein
MGEVGEMLASELYAISQGARNAGDQECHWCSSACGRLWMHDDPPPVPFRRSISTAKRPNNQYICAACWLWRRKRVTIFFLDGSLLDGREACNYSSFINEDFHKGIDHKKPEAIYPLLLSPPSKFSLSIIESPSSKNLLQLQVCNDLPGIRAEDELSFTLDNIIHAYSIYELEEALKHGGDGKAPGVQALLRVFGKWKTEEMENGKERKRGRPTNEDRVTPEKVLRRVIAKE